VIGRRRSVPEALVKRTSLDPCGMMLVTCGTLAMKENCWEFKNCGNLGCPTRTDETLNGIHGGTNGGRACWTVAGTLCVHRKRRRNEGGAPAEPRGIFAKELANCSECDFYRRVEREEGLNFLPALAIYERISKAGNR